MFQKEKWRDQKRPEVNKYKSHWDDRIKILSKQDQTNLQRNQNLTLENICDDLIHPRNKIGGGYTLNVFQPNFISITYYTFTLGFGNKFYSETEYGN